MMMRSRYIAGRLRLQYTSHCKTLFPRPTMNFSTESVEQEAEKVVVTHASNSSTALASSSSTKGGSKSADNKNENEKVAACGDVDEDEDMEQEEMFVEPHQSFEFRQLEWGGPRRGGRLPEPTRYGDWERKGRCTDF